MESSTLLWILAVILVIIGIAGTLLPVLPGVTFVFGGLLLAAFAEDFHKVGVWTLIILGVLTALAMAVDFFAAALGAKRLGASRQAIIGATVGTVAGIWFGLVGLLLGPFVGATVGELLARQDFGQASKVGFATWLGLALGAALKVAIAFTMVGVFLAAYLLSSRG